MSDEANIAQIARRAASRLAGRINPELTREVELALAEDPLEQQTERVLDPISLGALIVSLASFGWTVYRDLKKDHETIRIDRQATEKRIAGLLREEEGFAAGRLPPGITVEEQALVLDVVAAEIVAADPAST